MFICAGFTIQMSSTLKQKQKTISIAHVYVNCENGKSNAFLLSIGNKIVCNCYIDTDSIGFGIL